MYRGYNRYTQDLGILRPIGQNTQRIARLEQELGLITTDGLSDRITAVENSKLSQAGGLITGDLTIQGNLTLSNGTVREPIAEVSETAPTYTMTTQMKHVFVKNTIDLSYVVIAPTTDLYDGYNFTVIRHTTLNNVIIRVPDGSEVCFQIDPSQDPTTLTRTISMDTPEFTNHTTPITSISFYYQSNSGGSVGVYYPQYYI